MTTITIQLPDEQANRLAELARRENVSVEQLVQARVQLLLEDEGAFERAARYVIEKNRELYRRLA
jgi:hypothetical protein